MAKTVRRHFPVKGMGCAACVARVENTLREQPGVEKASVSLASSLAQVDYDPHACTPEGLRKAVQAAGYDLIVEGTEDEADDEADRSQADAFARLKTDTLLSVVLSLILMLLSMGFRDFPYKGYVLWGLATPVVFWCGRRFFSAAWKQLKHGGANMDTLVALSVAISYLFSVFNLLFPQVWTGKGLEAHLYFESSAMIITFILAGRLLEERAKRSTTASVRKLVALQPKTVTVRRITVEKGMPSVLEETVPVDRIRPGDIVMVKPGERIPVDGTVTEGSSYVDESMLTGEPVAVLKEEGVSVYAGTINQKGSFTVRTEKAGTDTVLSAIIRMVRDAQGSKAPVQRLVDRIAAVFVPVIIGISLVTLLCWGFSGVENAWTHGLLAMVTVLVIACPCSLGLATPTALVAGIGNGAGQGILIKDAESLEVAKKINAVVVDKTGTLTEGHPSVVDSVWDTSVPVPTDLRDVLYSLERKSSHPLAEAVTASLHGCDQRLVTHFETVAGAGVKGEIDGKTWYAGNAEWLRTVLPGGLPADTPAMLSDSIQAWADAGRTLILLFDAERVYAVLAVTDEVKSGSARAVSTLRRMSIAVHMLTGDNRGTAERIAAATGIEHVKAEVLPQDKALYVKDLQAKGLRVAMVGDGINDSAALAQADLGIAMGRGSDIAIDTSMATIVSSDLNRIPALIRLSRRTVRIIRENLFWAFFYNLLAVPVAAGVLYPVNGFLLNPMIAAACMALSSICVVSNSLRLK